MLQFIVYYLDRSFIITNEFSKNNSENNKFYKPEDISKFVNYFETNVGIKIFYFYTKNVGFAWNNFIKNFKFIEAAGGVVKNPNDEILTIYRLKKWDLPKGKIEKGESPEQTAVREIAEECGINEHKIVNKICETYHTYILNGQKILKKTYWFNFIIDNVPELIPQSIENIEKAIWLKPEESKKKLVDSYPSIRQVINSLKFPV